jgi:hypothetical protein
MPFVHLLDYISFSIYTVNDVFTFSLPELLPVDVSVYWERTPPVLTNE